MDKKIEVRDFDYDQAVADELYKIVERGFPDTSLDKRPVRPGDGNYIVRAVREAMRRVKPG